MNFSETGSYVFAPTLTGSLRVNQTGGGTTILTANNSYTGSTTITAGTLQLGNGGTTGAITGPVTDNATLAFDRSNAYTFASVISGTGGVSVFGGGTLALTATNTYTGATTVKTATLAINGGGAVTQTSGVSIGDSGTDNGVLNVGGTGGRGTLSTSGSLFVGNAGAGALNIGSGGSVIDEFGSIGQQAGSSGTATVSSGTWISTAYLYVGNSGTGFLSISGSGYVVGNDASYIGNGTSSYGSATVSGGTWYNPSALVVGNSGTGSLAISGSGYVTDSYGTIGDNTTSTGSVTVSGGTWNNSSTLFDGYTGTASLLVSGSGAVVVNSGSGILRLAGQGGAGTLQIGNGGAFSGSLGVASVNGGAGVASVLFDQSNGYVFAPVLTGSMSVAQEGTGTTILTASNNYTGSTTVAAGTLQLGNGGTTGSITGNVIDNGALAFDRSDTYTFVNVISGSGGVSVIGGGTLSLTATNTFSGTTTVGAAILDIDGGGAVTQTSLVSIGASGTNNAVLNVGGTEGAGMLATTGSLVIGNFGTGAMNLGASGTVSVAGYSYIGSEGTGTATVTGGEWTTTNDLLVGFYRGNGNLSLSGTGNVSVGGDSDIGYFGTGTAVVTGGTWNSGGNLVISDQGGSGALSLSGSGNVHVGGNSYVGEYGGTGSATVTGGMWTTTGDLRVGFDIATGNLSLSGSGNITDANGYVGDQGAIGTADITGGVWTNTGNLYLGGDQSGNNGGGKLLIETGGMVVVGGTMILGGNVNGDGELYMGGTSVGSETTSGTLIAKAIVLGPGWGTISFFQTDTTTVAAAISGAGIITQGGLGMTILTGQNTLEGTTTVSAGTLEFAGNNSAISGVVIDNSALLFAQSGQSAVSGIIVGSGGITQAGTGVTTMSGTNTYTGSTVINAGKLVAQSLSALGTGAVTVNAAGTLSMAQSLNVGGNLTLEGGTLQFQLTTTSTTSDELAVAGSLTGDGGTISLTGDNVTAGVVYDLILSGTNSLSLSDLTLINSIAGFTASDGFSGSAFYVIFSPVSNSINNQNGTSTDANFVANGSVSTSQTGNNTINSLTFNTTTGSSTLTVYNTLAITSGSLTVDSGTTTVLGGNAGANILTPGDFTKGGQGALVIDPMTLNVGANANINAGALDIQQSQMLVNGNVNISSGAALSIQQGSLLAAGGAANVSGTLNVQTGGTATIANALNISAGGVTTVNGGGQFAAGGPANVSGVFDVQGQAASGGLNINSGGVTTVSTGGMLAAGGSASVSGLFDVQSGGAAAIAGSTSVNGGGVLTVDGVLASQQGVLVAQSGLVNGSGVITGNVTNNGTVLPGDDPATITVAGNYVQNSGGTLNIEVASLTDYGVLEVSGAASLNGTLLVTPFSNLQFAYGQVIPNFLTAGSVGGSFSTVDVDDPGFRGRVLENGGNLSLLIAPSSYTQVAKNGNQYNVAKALNGFIPAASGDKQTVSTALDFLTASQYPAAFNAIMPDFYQTVTSIGLSLATSEGQIVDQRLSAIRMGSSGFAMQGVGNMPVYNEKGGDGKSAMDGKKDIISPASDNNWGVWVQGNGIFGHSYSISDVPNYNFESGGFLVGGDYRWNEHFSTGLFTGYQGAYGNYPNGGKVWMNGADFGTYATYDSKNGFYANAILMGAYSNYRVDRSIQFGAIDRTASSTPGGGDLGAFLEAGYDFKTSGFIYGPLANAQYTYLGIAPFTERNAGSLDLSMGSENLNSLQTNLGGHVAYTFILPNKYEIIPDLRMFWNHEFLQNPTGTQASLNGGGGPGFTYDTTTPSRDSVYAGLGINAQLGSRWNVGAYYNIDFGGYTSITHIVSANLGFSW